MCARAESELEMLRKELERVNELLAASGSLDGSGASAAGTAAVVAGLAVGTPSSSYAARFLSAHRGQSFTEFFAQFTRLEQELEAERANKLQLQIAHQQVLSVR